MAMIIGYVARLTKLSILHSSLFEESSRIDDSNEMSTIIASYIRKIKLMHIVFVLQY